MDGLYSIHSHKKRKDNLETRTKLVAVRIYIENQAVLEFILVSFFSFLCQDANKTGSNCAIIDRNLSKKHKLALYKIQNGEPSYVDHKFFFNVLLGATCTKTWGQAFKYYRTG